MKFRLPMLGETMPSPAEAYYLYNDYSLQPCQTTPNNLDMPVSAANGWQESEPSAQELNYRGKSCSTN